MTIDIHPISEPGDPLITALRQITVEQLLLLGTHHVVYLKASMRDHGLAFVLHGANGVPLVAVDDIKTAVGMAVENGLCFAAVH
jgi:hypothetical protein